MRWPGSTHDAHIFKNSFRRQLLKNGNLTMRFHLSIRSCAWGCHQLNEVDFNGGCKSTAQCLVHLAHITSGHKIYIDKFIFY